MKSHISPTGPGKCSAKEGNCPFGGSEVHFNSIVEARAAFETSSSQKYGETTALSKKVVVEDPEIEKSFVAPPSLANMGIDTDFLDRLSGVEFRGVLLPEASEPATDDFDIDKELQVLEKEIPVHEDLADMRNKLIDQAYEIYDRDDADEICEDLEDADTRSQLERIADRRHLIWE